MKIIQTKIVEKEAEIARILTKQDVPTPTGKKVWPQSTIQSILQNEKYKGDAVLQKTFCVDFLTKKMKINEGEIPQYYVENSYEAIVSAEIFNIAQNEIKKRKLVGLPRSSVGIFSSKIVCGDCGSYFGSKVWHSNTKYKRTIWQCRHKFKNSKRCSTPHFYEHELKTAFLKAFNQIISDKDKALNDCEVMILALMDTTEINEKIQFTQKKCEEILDFYPF